MSDSLKRVLFVCIGNACRSQMAEGFARTYGSDVMVPSSAGLAPAARVPSDTIRAMEEKNIDLRPHFPKTVRDPGRLPVDLVINMSGRDLRLDGNIEVREWKVEDPIAVPYERHCEIRDLIERLVMNLVIELRRNERRARDHNQHSR